MIAWKYSEKSRLKSLLYQFRTIKAQLNYFDHFGLEISRFGRPKVSKILGYQSKIAKFKDAYKGKEATVICNGPSLQHIDLHTLKKTITIGCNGVYKNFKEWGFHTDFLLFEDVEQFEIRASDVQAVNGPIKMAAIYNAYALNKTKDWLFFNSPRCSNHSYYWNEDDVYPLFSKDFASVAHLGSTVTYLMLQWAYHLGCDPVYIVGLDHNYGKLPELFPPGKIKITEENYEMVKECHFDPNYYKIGDVIGVPWVEKQNAAFKLANQVFIENKRTLINVSDTTKLTEIPIISVSEWKRMLSLDNH